MSDTPQITVIGDKELSRIETPCSGLTAHQALSTDQATLLQLSVAAERNPAWLRHPDRELYGFLRSGRLELTSQSADSLTHIEADADDCLRVPAGVDYQLSAVSAEPAVILVALVGSGPLFETVADPEPSASAPMVTPREEFVATATLENLRREMPFPDAPVQQVVGHADDKMTSEWHHHGDNDVFGHVLAGEGYTDDGSDDPLLATTGSWFHIPPGVVHRDVNPQVAEQDYVLWLTGSEPRIVYADEPHATA